MRTIISSQIQESVNLKQKLLEMPQYQEQIMHMAEIIIEAYRNGHMLMLCGNGGSAGDAQHLAGEMVARFKLERRALPALAFNTNSSVVTAIGNDYEYDMIFEKQVEAFGKAGDVLLAISTSGKSESVIRAMKKANDMGIATIALLGKSGGKCFELATESLVVPSDDTPRIQEVHIMVGHIICDIVEQALFGEGNGKNGISNSL